MCVSVCVCVLERVLWGGWRSGKQDMNLNTDGSRVHLHPVALTDLHPSVYIHWFHTSLKAHIPLNAHTCTTHTHRHTTPSFILKSFSNSSERQVQKPSHQILFSKTRQTVSRLLWIIKTDVSSLRRGLVTFRATAVFFGRGTFSASHHQLLLFLVCVSTVNFMGA